MILSAEVQKTRGLLVANGGNHHHRDHVRCCQCEPGIVPDHGGGHVERGRHVRRGLRRHPYGQLLDLGRLGLWRWLHTYEMSRQLAAPIPSFHLH